MDRTILARYSNPDSAWSAQQALVAADFDQNHISLLHKNPHNGETISTHVRSTTLNGFVSGVSAGAIIGAAVGYLIGVGVINFSGVNWFLLAVPAAHALGITGAAATTFSGLFLGGIVGGFVGSVMGLAVPSNDVFNYDEDLAYGESIVAVKTDGFRTQDAVAVLQDSGGYHIESRYNEDRAPQRSKSFYTPNAIIGYKGGKSRKKVVK